MNPLICAVQYADPGDEDEERPLHRAIARRAIDVLGEHCRFCPICLLHGARKCALASGYEKLIRVEAFRAGAVDRKAA